MNYMKFTMGQFVPTIILGLFNLSCTKNRTDFENPVQLEPPAVNLAKASTDSKLLFEETFEGPKPFSTAHSIETGPWDYAMQVVTTPVFQGQKAVRFEIRKDQPLVKTGKRSEVCIVKGSEGDITKEAWYSFSVNCPSEGYEF